MIRNIPVNNMAIARPRGMPFFKNMSLFFEIKSIAGSNIYAIVKARKREIRIPFR